VARIGVLGPLTVDGESGRLPPRAQVVLAALTVRRGEVVGAETLADVWWGERLPATWTKAVQGCLVQLRKVLGAAAIETRRQGYCLVVPADEIDAYRFERQVARAQELLALGEPDRAAYVAGESLDLWRGRALADLDGWEPGRVAAARLEELRLDAEELRVEATLRTGRFRDVLADAQAQVTEQPLREHRWILLALAQYQAGRQGDALRTLHQARRVLAEELGLDPGPDLLALEQAVLRQDPSLVAAQLPEPSPVCPYLGLVPYDVGDSDGFFGRDTVVSECLKRLTDTRALAVVGPSGCGKSSLVRAGVAAALQRHGRRVVVVSPGARPADALAALPSSGSAPVLIVDQCEEAVTLCTDAGERARFFAGLVEHAERAPLVVALRADRLGELSGHPGFARIVERGLFLVQAMGEDDLRAAIEGPARQAGLRLEPGLVDLLVRDVEGEPGALPLLSHALRQTWQRREGATLTVAGYRASGGIRGAVAQSAEQLYEQAPPEQRSVLRLVAPTPEGEPVRSRVPRRAIASDPEHERIIEQLIAARLVTSDEDVVELAHEALARAWPRLRAWLDDDVEGQRIWRHLAVAAESWDAMGRPDSELYRGVRLERALEWRDRATPDVNVVERAFLDTSRHVAETHRRMARRRRRTLTAVLAGGVAVATALGSFAVVQADRATSERDRALTAEQDAQVGALVNQSLALRSTDRAVAALLAVEAHRRAAPDDPRAHSALLGTFTAAPGFIGYLHVPVDGGPLAGAVVPGTSTAAVSANGHDLRMLDLDTGELDDRFPPLGDDEVALADTTYSVVRVSADGRYVAHLVPTEAPQPCFELDVLRVTDDAGCAALVVYDVARGERVLGPVTLPIGPGDLAVNVDGSLVAVAGGYDGKVAVYRTGSGEPVGIVPGMPRPSDAPNVQDTAAVGFGPDGRLYVGSLAGPVRAVDPSSLAVTSSYDAPPRSTNNHLTVTQGGVLVGAGDANLVAIDTAAGAVAWSADIVIAGDPFPCPYFAVSELMGRFYCGDYYGTLVERELATGGRTGVRLDPQRGDVGELAVGAGGRELVAFGGSAPIVSRWRLDGSGPIVDTSLPGWWSQGYDPAGELMLIAEGAAIDPPPDLAAWDPETGEMVDQLDPIVAAIWVAPGVLAAIYTDGTVGDGYDARAHTRGDGPPPRGVEVRSADLSAGGTRTYVEGQFDDGTDGRCEVWSVEVATQRYVGPVIDVGPCAPVRARDMEATADGSRVAYSALGPNGNATTVYDGRTGERLAGPVVGLLATDIGLDGTLYGGDDAGGVARYDLDTLEPIATFPQARGRIEALEVSDDGRRLLVGSANQTVSIYDVATRTRLGDPIDTGRIIVDGGAGPVLRPDGDAFVVNGRDGLAIWNIEPGHLADAACRFAGRNLTRDEWDAYLSDLGAYRATCPAYT
jgi:DNA-binding SARP family transcriptional activator/WD40 repeat protein/energy-coupling factor transporter ATP-binding protein EcfA2